MTEKFVVDGGLVRFEVTSDGTTGPQWVERLMRGGKRIGDYGMGVLLSPEFLPTSGIVTKVVVLPCGLFYDEQDRPTTSKICSYANQRGGLTRLNAEIACFIREFFSDKEIEQMGFEYIVAMHKAINISTGYPNLLGVSSYGFGHWLEGYCGKEDTPWNRHGGFAFAEQ